MDDGILRGCDGDQPFSEDIAPSIMRSMVISWGYLAKNKTKEMMTSYVLAC